MAQNKKHITPENITEWLSSTGFLFPRNEVELKRFEKLYGDVDFGLTGKEIDPDKIINGTFKETRIVKMPTDINQEEIKPYRMAARNGRSLPKHILDKIKKNQSKPKDDSYKSENTNK
ncbi:MAG: hypothetical protein GX877_07470 [Bacteroidales bacterium]|nr:hypothetical protein [Bacteroidales bacterium]